MLKVGSISLHKSTCYRALSMEFYIKIRTDNLRACEGERVKMRVTLP